MSLAYKLWKIGSVLEEREIKEVMKVEPSFEEDNAPLYVNIDFEMKGDAISAVFFNKESVSKNEMFFTKKVYGTSSPIYLYPNLNIQKDSLEKKVPQLMKILECTMNAFANSEHKRLSNMILDKFSEIEMDYEIALLEKNCDAKKEKKLEKLREELKSRPAFAQDEIARELLRICKLIIAYPKGNYWVFLTVNKQTIPKLMPEVWENWFASPFINVKGLKKGHDAFSAGKEPELVGYETDFKAFSYDQYSDAAKFRVNENLPLSLESARNIKFAWMYLVGKLVFFYKGLEYITIPNVLNFDQESYREVLKRLRLALKTTSEKPRLLEKLKKEEKKLLDSLKKMSKDKKQKGTEPLTQLEGKHHEISQEIASKDLGIISEMGEQAAAVSEQKDLITLDYIFVSINRTNLSFEIKGSIEDVIPSRFTTLLGLLRKYNVNDNVTPYGVHGSDKTLLQNYFNRDELYFTLNKSQQKNKNRILQERLFLARLLIAEETLAFDDLLKCFEFHREFDYKHNKRIKNGVKDWIAFPEKYTKDEENILNFLTELKNMEVT